MNSEIGVAVMSASAPGMQRETEPLLHRSGRFVAARMPARFPAHQLVRNVELFRVDLRARIEQPDVLLRKVEQIHVQFVRKIIERAPGKHTRLRMIRRAPCARRANVVDYVDVLQLLIGERQIEEVGNWRRTSSTNTSRAPGVGFPCQQRAVFLRADFYSSVCRRTTARGLQLSLAIEHHLYCFAASLL